LRAIAAERPDLMVPIEDPTRVIQRGGGRGMAPFETYDYKMVSVHDLIAEVDAGTAQAKETARLIQVAVDCALRSAA